MMPRGRTSAPTLALLLFTLSAVPARADIGVSTEVPTEEAFPWTFQGPLGRFDQAQLRRGFQVFTETCAGCHSLRYVAFRDLSALGIGFGPEDIKALAASYQVQDGPDENGKMFMRPAKAADDLPPPYTNKETARAANKGMYPPDLSLITRARTGGPDFLYALLTGYGQPPPNFATTPGMYYNAVVSGHQTGMQPPLSDGIVTYDDGTAATVPQMARDVTAFLAWAADPHMQERKALGFKVVIFLTLLTILFIALKLEVWAHLHPPSDPTTESDPKQLAKAT